MFYLKFVKSGRVTFDLITYNVSDLDFILWGPFDTINEGCGAALTSAMEIDCGWQRGPTLPEFAAKEPFSLEHATIPNAIAGKYYVLLINDETPGGNTTMYLEPTGTTSADSLDVNDCLFLTAVNTFSINGTGNATAYGTMPLVGADTTITFTGLFLNNMPYHDSAKMVAATDNCTGPSAGADREGLDLGPGDEQGVNTTTWTFSFLTGGEYKLCYKLFGMEYQQMGGLIEVGDNRVRPPTKEPGWIPDSPETNSAPWFDFEPKLVVKEGPVEFLFTGFEPYGYRSDMEIKVVVEDCLETFPSVAGLVPQKLSERNTAKFTLPEVGQYRFCIMHRKVWESSENKVQVTTPDNLQVYRSYSSCEQLLANAPGYCGCFFSHNNTASAAFDGAAHVPLDFSMSAAMAGVGMPPINQGCCALNSLTRETFSHPDKIWGMCTQGPSWEAPTCAGAQ